MPRKKPAQRPFLKPAMDDAVKNVSIKIQQDLRRLKFLNEDGVVVRLNKQQRELFMAYGHEVLGIDLERVLQYFLMRGIDDVIRSGILGKAIEERKLVRKILKDARQ
jgi:hypothetical protein